MPISLCGFCPHLLKDVVKYCRSYRVQFAPDTEMTSAKKLLVTLTFVTLVRVKDNWAIDMFSCVMHFVFHIFSLLLSFYLL